MSHWCPAPGIYCTLVEGFLEIEAARAIISASAVASAEKPIIGYHDWAAMSGYTSEARKVLMDYGSAETGKSIVRSHVLISSPVVAIGVNVAATFVGGLTVYSNRSVFEGHRHRSILNATTAAGRES